jgi:hypothetical protein
VSNDIEQLKQDFLCYINFLAFPSPETLVEKIQPLQKTELKKISFQSDSVRNLSIISEDQNATIITLNEKDLEIYAFSIENFKKSIEGIKHQNSEKLFFQALEEVINFHYKKLCEIYVPLILFKYIELYEKFKLENPNVDGNRIYYLIDKTIEKLLIGKQASLLTYNYFKRAYQEYANSMGFTSLFATETENLRIIFNITKELKINFTLYQSTYATLINLFEKFYICATDKQAAQILIEELKNHTNSSFSNLIQKSFGKQNKKTIIKDFKLTAQELIKNYIKDHPDECKKQQSVLDYLLEFITKIIPESILSEDKRMTLFGKYTETGRQIKSLSNQIIKENDCFYFPLKT